MSNPFFRFKQFLVFHSQCAMKVGVDGVLLGAWTDVQNAENILDIGTGCGLIALMLAQRAANAVIDAVEIDNTAAQQAAQNVCSSKWHNRINVINADFLNFTPQNDKKYDLIVSNPPFFENSLVSPDKQRTTARHTAQLSNNQLLMVAEKLLAPQGKISLILPFGQEKKCMAAASVLGLYCTRLTAVVPKPCKPPKRILLELQNTNNSESQSVDLQKITIETENRHEYTDEYVSLVKDFYLKMYKNR